MTIPFLRPAKFFLTFSTIAAISGVVLLIVPGPKLSIDFTGGTLVELKIPSSATKEDLQKALASVTFDTGEGIGSFSISSTRSQTMLIRLRDLSNEEHLALIEHLSTTLGETDELQFTTIGPTVGATLKRRSLMALAIASVAIVVYLAFAFRKVPRRLSPWRFGIIAVVSLLHDVAVTVGIFVLLSHWTSFEMDTLFVTALLTIIGYSVNDTIVIFDRIRDNVLTQERNEPFAAVCERSLNESLTRTINTVFSTLIMLFALVFLGSQSIRWFVLTLIVGCIVGTYSSIFLATPLLVYWRKRD
ncbi:protein translocase subunit SecF [Candidatus Peregrinibacteria bacterium CG10_big_fil_rev_8_21_14_0_10_55_24]|nr:MAG: protein translocase subunit SecF [Candidatus Peregrinibacteria bacterium CG10_big_fil_rev_8_21_14_0_10_55_24]